MERLFVCFEQNRKLNTEFRKLVKRVVCLKVLIQMAKEITLKALVGLKLNVLNGQEYNVLNGQEYNVLNGLVL